MKAIDVDKRQILSLMLSKNAKHIETLSDEDKERFVEGLERAAEIKALREAVIPDGFRKYTFDDFDGQVERGKSLSLGATIRAKEAVSQFCWGQPLSDIVKMSSGDRASRSVVGQRVTGGSNVVIHGDSLPDTASEGLRFSPIGRTFVAAIMTREAISLKLKPQHRMLTYDWVEFASLRQSVIDNDGEKLAEYQTADWLVVDNIVDSPLRSSQAAKDYLQSKLDPFFFYRLEYKRPTVLVFKFDVASRLHSVEESFGTALSRIVGSDKTFNVRLSDKDINGRR